MFTVHYVVILPSLPIKKMYTVYCFLFCTNNKLSIVCLSILEEGFLLSSSPTDFLV